MVQLPLVTPLLCKARTEKLIRDCFPKKCKRGCRKLENLLLLFFFAPKPLKSIFASTSLSPDVSRNVQREWGEEEILVWIPHSDHGDHGGGGQEGDTGDSGTDCGYRISHSSLPLKLDIIMEAIFMEHLKCTACTAVCQSCFRLSSPSSVIDPISTIHWFRRLFSQEVATLLSWVNLDQAQVKQ